LEITQKLGKRVLARAETDRVGVPGGLVGQRRDVQAAEHDVHTAGAIAVGDLVRAIGVRDVDLDDDEIGCIVQVQRLDVLVLQHDLDGGVEVGGEGGQAQGRKERVLDGAPVRAGRLRQRGQQERDAPEGHAGKILCIAK